MKRVILLTVFVDALGFGIVVPFLPLYASSLGASGFEVGLLLATYSLMQMLVAPWWGRLSDRVGRKPIIVIAAAGTCASFVVLGGAATMAMILVGRALLGCFGVGMITAQAWVADTTSGEDRGRALATLGAANALGHVVGPALGAVGVLTGGLAVPFWLAAACAGANAILALVTLPAIAPIARHPAAARFRDLASSRSFVVCVVVSFALTYAFSNIEATFALFTRDQLGFSPFVNGMFFVYLGVAVAVTQLAITRSLALPDYLRVTLGLALLAIGAFGLPFVHSAVAVLPPVTVMAAGFAITMPSLTAWVSRSAAIDRQGEAIGVAQSAGAMARIVGPWLGGLMYDQLGHGWPFWTAGLLLATTATAVLVVTRGRRARLAP